MFFQLFHLQNLLLHLHNVPVRELNYKKYLLAEAFLQKNVLLLIFPHHSQ